MPGQGVDTDEIVAELPAAADGRSGGDGDDASGSDDDAAPTTTRSRRGRAVEVAPRFTDAEAQELADQANAMTANGLTLTAGETSKQVGPDTLRTWIAPTTADGALELTIVPDAVNAAVPEVFSDLSAEPKDASFDLQNGTPVVVPSQQGVVCCGPNSADLVWEALSTAADRRRPSRCRSPSPSSPPRRPQGLGIVQPVGGNNAWRNGAPRPPGPASPPTTTRRSPGSPTSTAWPTSCGARSSCRARRSRSTTTVGPRTAAKGFVVAGRHPRGRARRRDRRRRVAVRHHHVQRRLLRRASTSPSTRRTPSTSRATHSAARPRWATRRPTCRSPTTRPTAS